MASGKTIRIFLADGSASGILVAEIINWTGSVLVAPRAKLPELAKREECKRTGVYCLVGPDPEATGGDRVYIGEGDNVLARLTEHERAAAKDFWTRTVVINSKDMNLTKAHARYLESRLIQMARSSGRASVANNTAPERNPLPEPDIADMEFFLDQVELVLPVLGFDFLRPASSAAIAQEDTSVSPVFEIRQVGVVATAQEIGGEFIVKAGSTARKEGAPSWTTYRGLRDQLVHAGKLRDSDDAGFYEFAEDVPFSSPSAAAATVLARGANGRTEWQTRDTRATYQGWLDQQIGRINIDIDSD
ncbi:MAG: GIY-YIG nuclease family protein [Dehalococcoidia bacterium]